MPQKRVTKPKAKAKAAAKAAANAPVQIGPLAFTTALEAAAYFGRSEKEIGYVVSQDMTAREAATFLALDEDELTGLEASLPDLPDITITPTPPTGAAPLSVSIAATNAGGTVDTWECRPNGAGTTPVLTTTPPWAHVYAAGNFTPWVKGTNETGSSIDTASVLAVAP